MNQTISKPRNPIVTFFKWVFVLLLLAVAAFVIVGMFVLDGKFDFSRSLTMKGSPEDVHKLTGDLREWPKWLPFTKHDKSVKTTIEQPTGVGANQHWTSDNGNGELKFTASDEAKGVDYDMTFDKKWLSHGSLTYSKSADQTQVTWRMYGNYDDFMGKWMAFVLPYMVGPMFEEGLKDLKSEVEKNPQQKPQG